MKNNFRYIKNRLLSDRLFMFHFLQLFVTMVLIFALFTVFTYHNSRKIIENEFSDAGMQDLQNISRYMEDLIVESKDMIATLVINKTLRSFYASPSPEDIWSNYSTQVKAHLSALRNSRECIEDIYLYSEASNTIYSYTNHYYMDTYDDRYWFEHLNPDNNGFSVFPYAMNTRYPRVICVVKEFVVDDYHCAVAIMLNPAKIPIIASTNENNYQSTYIISDDNKIIYRHLQETSMEPLDTVPYLVHFEPNTKEKVLLSTESTDTYSYAQLHSEYYPWSYVLVTYLQNYTSRLSTQNALLFAVSSALIVFAVLFATFFAIRSLKPIENIRHFLEFPELLSSESVSTSADIKYIAGRITQYIQTNQELKDELNERLHLLNETQMAALQSQINPHFLFNTLNMMYVQSTDSLGYDHTLPMMILNTSSLIRYALEPEKLVSLETELSYTDIYLSILNLRYNNQLTIIRSISPDTLTTQVPRLFIQPLIENAVFHGFSNLRNKECILNIRCYRQTTDEESEEFIVVEIRDNGKGIDPKKLNELRISLAFNAISSSKSIGLRNVVQRMNLTYADRFSLNIESNTEKGTCFLLRFPYVT